MIARILPFAVADGPGNMAMDEALLEAAEAGVAVFRTYGWSQPTLSLGYFQKEAEARADPRWRDVPTVRRPTGGGALWHDREITYALAIPRSHPLARRHVDLYEAVHEAIAADLRALGLAAMRRGSGAADRDRPFLCFRDTDPSDVVIEGAKVVGSAQRRRAGAVLQHGSLLLTSSPDTPELPGLAEVGGGMPDRIDWASRLAILIATACGLEVMHGAPDEGLQGRAAALRPIYADPARLARR